MRTIGWSAGITSLLASAANCPLDMDGATAHTVYEYTPDGWLVSNRDLFCYLVDHDPPRPSRLWRQLRIDASGGLTRIVWAIGLCFIALAAWSHWWVLALPSVILFVFYVRILRLHLGNLRDQAIYRGVIDVAGALRPHPLFPACAVADAQLPSGEIIPVSFDRNLVEPLLADGRTVQVVFDHGPNSEYGGVIGARPARS